MRGERETIEGEALRTTYLNSVWQASVMCQTVLVWWCSSPHCQACGSCSVSHCLLWLHPSLVWRENKHLKERRKCSSMSLFDNYHWTEIWQCWVKCIWRWQNRCLSILLFFSLGFCLIQFCQLRCINVCPLTVSSDFTVFMCSQDRIWKQHGRFSEDGWYFKHVGGCRWIASLANLVHSTSATSSSYNLIPFYKLNEKWYAL